MLVMHVLTSQVKEIGMNRRLVLSVIASAPLLSAQTKQSSIRERVLGAWDLISWEETDAATGDVTRAHG